uniref:Ig-like domain-containing protein n=1 Tax=Paramormyrops kingsleyae TaxID=1676925 RepID=A0A3B3SAU9_9TELE
MFVYFIIFSCLFFSDLHDFPPDERSPQTVYEGAGATLTCHPPSHYPTLSYRWFFNEFPNFVQTTDGRWFISQVTGNLYIATAEVKDSGNYFCFTTNNMEISTKSVFSRANPLTVLSDAHYHSVVFSLVVFRMICKCGLCTVSGILITINNFLIAQPEWLHVMSDSEVEISSELRWSCASAGKPRPSVRWLRNGQSIINGGLLKISHLALEDSGMYQCVAENKHGTIYSNAELRVQVLAPDFRQNPVRRLVPAARGGQVMMECKPRAAPKPTLFWSRGTELLTNNSRVTVTPDGNLWITNISRADEGKYTCFAENYLGKANSTGHLSVRGMLSPQLPLLLTCNILLHLWERTS